MISNPNLHEYYEQHHRPHAWRWWRPERPGGPPWNRLGWIDRLVVLVRYLQKRLYGYFPFSGHVD